MSLKENLQRLDFSNCNISEIINGLSDVYVDYESFGDTTRLDNRVAIYNCFIYSLNADVLKTISNQSDNGITSITDIKNDYKCVIVSFTSDEIMNKFKELHELNLQHNVVLLDCTDKMYDFICSTKKELTDEQKDEIKKSLLFVTRHQLNIKASDIALNDRYATYIKNKLSPEKPTTEFDNELKVLFQAYERELYVNKYRVYIESNSSLAILLKDLSYIDDVVVEYVGADIGVRTNYYIAKNTLYLTIKWGDVCFTTLKLNQENVKQSIMDSIRHDLQINVLQPSTDFTSCSGDNLSNQTSSYNLINNSDFINLAQKIKSLNPTQVTLAKSSNEKSFYKVITDLFNNRVIIGIVLKDGDFQKFDDGKIKLFNINPMPQTVISVSTFDRVLNPYYNSAFDLFHILGENVEISDFIRNEIVGEIHNRVIDNNIFEMFYSDVYEDCDTKLKITDGTDNPTFDLLYEDDKFVLTFNITNDFIKKYSVSESIFDGCLKDKTKDDIVDLIHRLIVRIHTVNCNETLQSLLQDLETKSNRLN